MHIETIDFLHFGVDETRSTSYCYDWLINTSCFKNKFGAITHQPGVSDRRPKHPPKSVVLRMC